MSAEFSLLAIPVVFAAGVISFLSPCVLPLVPAYISYISGESISDLSEQRPGHGRLPAVARSAFFVLGFSIVFIVLGASASMLGRALLQYRYEMNIVGGSLIVAFGLFMTGLIRLPSLYSEKRLQVTLTGGGPLSAFALGLAFGFGWTPCIGPILGAILSASAVAATMSQGIAMLGVYAMGLGLPFLLAALFAGSFLGRLKHIRRIGQPLHIAAGVILIITGIAMISGYLSVFGFWLLNTFPVFSAIG
ncbi:MAG: cytochrome c biogenesis protein CcdA [Burkholderiales bacterium]|nr:cytochrome c biogenesis protein CcdA [Burkholderiales bacterium]